MRHDFWLFEEGKRAYADYDDLLPRRDAPVVIHDDILRYFADTLAWVPTLNPGKADIPSGHGLNWYGPTIINQTGGALFQQVCASWAQLFSHGPEQLKLHGPFSWEWPFEEEEHVVSMEQLGTFGDYERLEVERDWLVQTLTTLAQFGEQASQGGSFILHIGM